MSDGPPGSGNSQKVLQQILLQYAAQQQQQQSSSSPRGTSQNIVLSVPVGTPRTLPRLSLSPSSAVAPGVAIVSGTPSPLALQAQALASRLSQQQQAQSFVQVSPSPLRGTQASRGQPTSPQIVQGVPVLSPPNVYMVPGSQRSLQLPAGSSFVQPQSRSPKAVAVAPAAAALTQAPLHGSQASPRRHPLGKADPGRSPVAKGHAPSPKAASKAPRTIPSHSSSSVVKLAKKPTTIETMSQQKPAALPTVTMDVVQLTQDEIVEMRAEILRQRRGILRELNVAYIERLTESFFLQRGGNMMDYLAWKKKVSNHTLNAYLTKHKLEEKTSRYNLPGSLPKVTSPATTPTRRKSETEARLGNGAADVSRKRTHQKAGLDAFDFNDSDGVPPPAKVSGGFPIASKGISQSQLGQLKVQTGGRPKDPKSPIQGPSASPVRRFLTPGAVPKQSKSPLSPGARDRLPTRQQSLSAVYDYSIGSQEMIVERAKQEAQVMQRISELRKEGLWSAKRLPKVQEPPRYKTHWDYLLDEMQWLATDFAQERRWKKAAAKKLARAVAAYHRDKQAKEIKAERDEANKLRKIASNIAKEVRQFWGNIEKVVQYKQQSRLDEKRKKALDMQLDFIVGQTEKYSSWLSEGLNLSEKGSIEGSVTPSIQGSLPTSPEASDVEQNDVEFRPMGVMSEDDEETIDVEERVAEGEDNANELELLQRESEQPIEDILSKLPPPPVSMDEAGTDKEEEKDDLKTVLNEPGEPKEEGASTEDEEFVAEEVADDVVDDEDTIAREEELAGSAANHKEELDDLQTEGELPIEELLKKYAGAYEEGFEVPSSSDEFEMDSDDESEYEPSEDEDDAGDEGDEDGELKDIGMEYLLNPEKGQDKGESEKKADDGEAGPNQEITDIAKAAESLQPKGYTLSDTQVTTRVPSLLKHTLREYQHIGLDWLVTMNDKKLNGILADEMGLGKTIQTIALLAHLACEKSNWGPHLIVVPTSVMLNWEMEFKKWCPGFKILTYFGSQKERKQKRTGWTKQNAFHVCITSYKLVIQDHSSFRRKKWKYLVLDEAQNIKNFKSQRWQTLLNFNSQRRLLLTGTPLQNNLMELWSLMHFLMPHVFQSHREFREWFSNPMSGMIEGSQEYNEGLIKRLHKVLRPFLLRRLKSQVEKQLPQKYEHVVKCRLSKRQRFLYDDFMARTKTKETLKTGQFLSVINVLMQLRKVCNHPDLFELRPSISPFVMGGIDYHTASEVTKALEYHPLKHVNLANFNLCLADLELTLPAYIAHRTRQLQTPRRLIEEIDSIPNPPPRPPQMKMKPGKLLTPPGVAHVQREKLPMGRSSPSQQQRATPGRASPLRAASPIRSVLRATSPLMSGARATSPLMLGGRASPGATQVILRSPLGTPVPRQTAMLPHGYLAGAGIQHTIIPTLGGGSFALVSNPNNPGTYTIVQQQPAGVPSATPLQQLPGYMATSMGPLAQQRLLQQQQQQQLLNHLRQQQQQQQLITGRTITPYSTHQNLRGATSPISQLGQISRGGVIQLIRPSVPLVNNTPLSPPHSVIIPSSQSPRIRPASQPLVQVIHQQQQPLSIPHRPPQNVVQAATIGPRLSATPPMVNRAPPVAQQRPPVPPALGSTSTPQRSPTVAQQLMQRNLQATHGIRPVGTVAPIQLSTVATRPQATGPSSTPVVVSSSAVKPGQRSSGIAAAMAAQPTSSVTTAVKSASPVPTPSKGIVTDVAKKPTASNCGGGLNVIPSIASSKRPVVRVKLLQKADLERFKSGELFRKEAAEAEKKALDEKRKSAFYMESLEQRLRQEHRDTLRRVARLNFRRCCAKPIYGEDLYSVVSIASTDHPATTGNDFSVGAGLVHCHCCLNGTGSVKLDAAFSHTTHLQRLLNTPEGYLDSLKEIVRRFAFVIPTVSAPGISLSVSHPSPAAVSDHKAFRSSLSDQLHRRLDILHPLESRMRIQFPELRLIQYDCGKLQALDELLRRLKVGSHRVLIFTQMAKMLDVLERFLNFHGHIYLRLDGATKIENRQILMERFNADKRIFCFILSTRSGGVGVNLTGADTVIFYDSDWNPTMDAQAQDRCHRIGQTRDVHIYRLISEMTIEENIIKKANQKKLLADVSIDGGNFTTAFFRKTAITDLFEVDEDEQSGTKEVVRALPPPAPVAASPAQISQKDLEQALAKAEDESDVRAATMAHAERDAELAEFDEDIPYEGEDPSKEEEGSSKVEMELAQLDNQLTPIEKYAVKYMETTLEPINTEQLKEAEEMIEESKKEWELGCLQVMTKEAEQKAEMEEDDIFFTYDREDAMNKEYISQNDEIMPIWAPPTPPKDDNDVYIDHSMMLMYEQSTMTESQLPPVFIKKETKRIKMEHVRKIKSHKPELPHVGGIGGAGQTPSVMAPPTSLFNRPSAALLRMRRELAKQQQIRAMAGKPVTKPYAHRPATDTHMKEKPEWLINEDWALLQAIQTLQELPLALQPLIPGHTINWDLVSDIVNSCSRIYRSPKQCKLRYEGVIIPREEGKLLHDGNPKKQKKNKSIYRTKSNRPMKTGQLHAQDSNTSQSGLFSGKFEGMKVATAKRTPFCKQVLTNPLLKNPKHSAVLNEMNISYDKPMTPAQVAAKRAERIAKEKKQQQEQLQQQRLQAAKAQQQKQTQKTTAQPTTATVIQAATIARGSVPAVVSAVRGTNAGSIVVNTSTGATGGVTFATINKRMTQQQLTNPTVTAATAITAHTVAGSLAQVVRAQGVRTIPVTAIISTQTGPVRTTSAVVSSIYTSSPQQATATGTSQVPKIVTSTQLKNLGPVHIAFLKQQALRKQQQMKQLERAKLQQQAQAQAQAVQVQAQAQAQASHQQVQLQTLTKLAVPSGSTTTTTITQQQLTALHQQQLAQKLRSPEVQAILKQRAKGLSTVKGLTVSSVPGVASQVLSQAQAQIKQQAVTVSTQPGTTLKTLTLPQGTTVGPAGSSGTPQKVNFLQLVQMPKQTHKVGTGQPQQLSLSRVQQVGTPGQGVAQNATLVQRVVAGQVRPQVQTVRQQLQQSQVKRNQGTTLSIQQAGKPVTIIPHGSSVRTATPKVSTSVTSQQYTQLMANSKQVLTQLVQQAGGQTSTPQLARIISQPAVTSLQAKQAGQSMAQAILIQEDPPMVSISNAPNTITTATSKQAVAAATSLQSIVAARQAGAQQGTSGVKQAALSISNVLAAATRKPTAATNVQATAPGKQSVVTVQQATGTSKPSTAIMQAVAGMARPSVTQQLALGAHRMVQHSNITSRSATAGSGQAAIVISQASLGNKQSSAAGSKQASAASSIQSSVANTVQTATLKQQGPVQAVTQPAATTVSQQTISATPQPTTSSAQQAGVVEQSPTGSSATGVATLATTTPATTTPLVTTGKGTVIEEVGGSEEGDGEQGDSKDPDAVRASPYAMRLRKPSQSGN